MEKQGKEELIVLIDQSGLTREKTSIIAENLSKFFDTASEWAEKIDQIVVNDPTQTREMKVARETRLMLRQYRLDAQKLIKQNRDILKEQMSDQILMDKLYMNAGKMISATFENLETKLEQKEKFAERWENEQRAILRSERLSKLQPFTNDASIYPVEQMTEIQFNELLQGLKSQKEQKEYEAEQQRLRNEHIEFENEMIRRQNELLKLGYNWNGSEFEFQTRKITPDQITVMTINEFENELNATRKMIRELIEREKTPVQQPKLELIAVNTEQAQVMNITVKQQPKQELELIAVNIGVNKSNQKSNYIQYINNLRLDIFLGNMPLDMDLIDKFNGYKEWAIKRIENEYK
jgi:hypothetical protein